MSFALKKSDYAKFIISKEWAVIRADLFHVRGRFCEVCGNSRKLQVHHLNYERLGGNEEPDDLIILCGKCHLKEHGLEIKNGVARKKKVKKHKRPKKKREKKIRQDMSKTTSIETVEEFLARGGKINALAGS